MIQPKFIFEELVVTETNFSLDTAIFAELINKPLRATEASGHAHFDNENETISAEVSSPRHIQYYIKTWFIKTQVCIKFSFNTK